MRDAFSLIWLVLIGLFRSRASLQVEIVTLRHQLNVLRRKSPQRLGARFVYAMTCKSLEEARLKASEAFPAFGGSQTFFNIAPTSFAPTVKVEADDGELGYVAQLYSQEKKVRFQRASSVVHLRLSWDVFREHRHEATRANGSSTAPTLLHRQATSPITACASREELAAKKAAAEQAAQASREARCASFGYQRGSADYSKCLESLYLQDRQLAAADEANRQARVQAAAQGLQQAGAALQSISPPPPQPMVHCNTTGMGTSTTCF